jgi:hypothetical protein
VVRDDEDQRKPIADVLGPSFEELLGALVVRTELCRRETVAAFEHVTDDEPSMIFDLRGYFDQTRHDPRRS